MSSFLAKKLDMSKTRGEAFPVKRNPTKTRRYNRVMAVIRRRIEAEGEHLWRLEDFQDLPFNAAAKALSRLAREGTLQRLSKGVYYSSRQTAFGKSRPNPTAIQRLATKSKS